MKADFSDKIKIRVSKSNEAFAIATYALENKYYDSVASRLYYTCFHLISALFAKYGIETFTHNGVKSVFAKNFIKQKKIEPKWGKLLATLFDARQLGDYGDFSLITEEELVGLIKQVEEFKQVMLVLINEEVNSTDK
jgi:uncharacterized protein (UPF0332 family)